MEWANREMERKVNEKVLSAISGRVVSRTHFQTVFVGQYEKKAHTLQSSIYPLACKYITIFGFNFDKGNA